MRSRPLLHDSHGLLQTQSTQAHMSNPCYTKIDCLTGGIAIFFEYIDMSFMAQLVIISQINQGDMGIYLECIEKREKIDRNQRKHTHRSSGVIVSLSLRFTGEGCRCQGVGIYIEVAVISIHQSGNVEIRACDVTDKPPPQTLLFVQAPAIIPRWKISTPDYNYQWAITWRKLPIPRNSQARTWWIRDSLSAPGAGPREAQVRGAKDPHGRRVKR